MEYQHVVPEFYGWMAEFTRPEELVAAAQRVSEEGYTNVEAYVPFPVHGLPEALRLGHTWMPQIVFAGGALGLLGGYALLVYITVLHYPLNIGGRPWYSWQAYIPILFETTVLSASIIGVLGLLFLCGFPRPYHPVFNVPAFRRASQDKFFLAIEHTDPRFDIDETRRLLEGLHPVGVHYVED
jgi:hypothetical protein